MLLKIRHFLLPLLALTCILPPIHAWNDAPEAGTPLFQSYGPKEHGGGGISFAITEDPWRNLYFGNEAGVLRYDGTYWTQLPQTGNSKIVRSLSIDADNRLWAAGTNTVGYYSITATGEYAYTDLSASVKTLPGSDMFGQFFSLHSDSKYVYLITSFAVLRWDGAKWHSWPFPAESRILPSMVDGTLYIHSRGHGLFRLENENWVQLTTADKDTSSGIIKILPGTDNSLLCVTIKGGLIYFKNGSLHPFRTQIDDWFEGNLINDAVRLPNENIALATQSKGLLILNKEGRLITQIHQAGSWAIALRMCENGNLWSAQSDRIVRAPVASVSRYHVNDVVDDIIRHDGKLYLACRNTLKVLQPRRATEPAAAFTTVSTETAPYSMISVGHDLIYGGVYGPSILSEDKPTQKIEVGRQVFSLAPDKRDPSIVYIADLPMVSRLQKQGGQWHLLDTVSEDAATRLSLAQLTDGSLLATSEANPVQQIIWPVDHTGQAEIRRWTGEHGLPQKFKWAYCLNLRDTYVLISDRGAYRYDSQRAQFDYDPVLGDNLGDDAYGLEYAPLADNSGWALWLPVPEKRGEKGHAGALRIQEDHLDWEPWQLPAIDELEQVKSIYHEQIDGHEILWLGGTKDLFRYDLTELPDYPLCQARLISISENETSTTYYGGAGAPPTANTWDYPQKTLHFHFGAHPSPLSARTYQSRLVGFEKNWLTDNQRTSREFTNLHEGDYSFEVRVIDELGRPGPIESFQFTILPPWYRTSYAYVGDLVLLAAVIILISRWWTQRLRKQNLALETMVNLRTVELERRNLDLIHANHVKQDFLASMSHEIRNPLNGILGITQLLRESDKTDKAESERIRHLHSCASHLHQLLGQVLDYSSLESGKLQARCEPFDVNEVIVDVVAMHRSLAEQKGLNLEVEAPEIQRYWIGDATILRQVLINLLSNAIKYTPSGSVRLQLHVDENPSDTSACFSVEDSGPGIPEDKRDYIFEDFTRLAKPGEGQIPGTGLGLAIASHIARLTGAALRLDASYTKGARFVLEARYPLGNRIGKGEIAPLDQTARMLLKGKKVLVADDMDFNRYICKELLDSLGASVEMAVDGRQALKLLNQTHFDLAILDINMPELSGIEVVTNYLTDNPIQPPLLVALSAHVTSDMEARCMENGFNHFIEKPLDPEKLRHILHVQSLSSEAPKQGMESLLDYLAQNDPKAKEALQTRYRESFLKELGQLRNAIRNESTENIRASIHKLKGLSNIQRDATVIELLDRLSEVAHSGSIAQLQPLCERIEARIEE